MSTTIIASDGTRLPIDHLDQSLTYAGDLVTSISVMYRGIQYTQTFTYEGTNVIEISQWRPN